MRRHGWFHTLIWALSIGIALAGWLPESGGLSEAKAATSQESLTSSGIMEPMEKPSLSLRAFSLETSDTKIYVSTGLLLEHPAVVRSLLRDGATMNLTCLLKLERVRSLLTNEVVAEEAIVYHIRHEPLTREFVVLVQGVPQMRHKKFDTLFERVWNVLELELPLEHPLISGDSYRINMTLTLQHAEVPPWLEKALFFWSWDVAPPVSFTQQFDY